MTSAAQPPSSAEGQGRSRSKTLQLLGILSGFTAGAWLGAAEAPTKLVSIGISPMAISLIMVIGVFLALWSLPALILGTSSVRADVRRAQHLIVLHPKCCRLHFGCNAGNIVTRSCAAELPAISIST